jgi:hypothetical protein
MQLRRGPIYHSAYLHNYLARPVLCLQLARANLTRMILDLTHFGLRGSMTSIGEASTLDDGFTMDFTLDVVSNIAQDVEDVARQGALGNFRKAHSMYEEALKPHRAKFPVYAEYLRLCLDGGDWASLARNFAGPIEGVAKGWNGLEYNVVELLRAESQSASASNERTYERSVSSRRLHFQLEATNFLAFDTEQVCVFQSVARLCLTNAELDIRCCDLTSIGLLGSKRVLTIGKRPMHASRVPNKTKQLLGVRVCPRGLLLHIR